MVEAAPWMPDETSTSATPAPPSTHDGEAMQCDPRWINYLVSILFLISPTTI